MPLLLLHPETHCLSVAWQDVAQATPDSDFICGAHGAASSMVVVLAHAAKRTLPRQNPID
jgi:hypothetical protein